MIPDDLRIFDLGLILGLVLLFGIILPLVASGVAHSRNEAIRAARRDRP